VAPRRRAHRRGRARGGGVLTALREFVLPDLGEGLDEAELVRWLVSEGDDVELNQTLAEVETAKATVELPSPYAGRIAKLHVGDGSTVEVGAPLVTFEVEGAGDALAVPAPHAPEIERARATPAVRRLAKELGVDLSGVAGSGPGGRVARADVIGAAKNSKSTDAPEELGTRLVEVPGRVASAPVLERQAAIPHVTTFRTVECTALEELRRELDVSPLPIVARALAEIRAAHPMLNASWTPAGIAVHERVDVGIAVDTERGLVVPVVRDAGSLGIRAIAEEVARLASAARGGRLTPADLGAATLAITNTGSYGSEYGTPLLSPGTAVTIALGAIEPRALVIDGAVVARPACTLSVTFDHRVLDGADVGRALAALVPFLESAELLKELPR